MKSIKQLTILIVFIMGTISVSAQDKTDLKQVENQLNFFLGKIGIPSDYLFKSVYQVKVDHKEAYWFRYEKEGPQKLLGEHYSFVVTKASPYLILGFTYMDTKYLGGKMISKAETEKIASDFLETLDPKLNKELENQWIDQHDEEIIVDGKSLTISGMKYKCYNKSNSNYAWVIVGHDGTIITFERDIIWSNGMQERVTNKWLHDNWLLSDTNIKEEYVEK